MCEGMCRNRLWRSSQCCYIASFLCCIFSFIWLLLFFLWALPELNVVKYQAGQCYIFSKSVQCTMCNNTQCCRPAFQLYLHTPSGRNVTTVAYNSVTGSYSTNIQAQYRYYDAFPLFVWFKCYFDPKDLYRVVFYHRMPVGPIITIVILGVPIVVSLFWCARIALAFLCEDCECDCDLRLRRSSSSQYDRLSREALFSDSVTPIAPPVSYGSGANATGASINAPSVLPPPPTYEYAVTHPSGKSAV
eukprot:c54243_g1_i1.p1 GENE.c54243_g1_i1~~c54243_g1_i1.p1  ORF type:complete len:263 (-),score=27.02 c54243_g1_i1:107-844(-)